MNNQDFWDAVRQLIHNAEDAVEMITKHAHENSELGDPAYSPAMLDQAHRLKVALHPVEQVLNMRQSTAKHNKSEALVTLWEIQLVASHFTKGGGFSRAIALEDFVDQFTFVDEGYLGGRPFKKMYFSFDNEDQAVEGFTQGDRWNGWATPFFTKDQIKSVQLLFDDKLIYLEDRDAYALTPDPGEEDEIWVGETIPAEGQQVKAYPIGSWCYCWDSFEESDLTTHGLKIV